MSTRRRRLKRDVAAASSPLRPAIVPLAGALPRVYGAVVERLAR